LRWALERMRHVLLPHAQNERARAAWWEATAIGDEDVGVNRCIGEHGLKLIRECFDVKRATVNIMTHCNAGWLATVDYGTALAPVYVAHDAGIPVHVWVQPGCVADRLGAWPARSATYGDRR
jgi:methylthioribose-1-phosphate isomerase